MRRSKAWRSRRLLGDPWVVFASVLALHLLTLSGGYVYDDVEAIVENPLLRSFSHLPDLFRTNYWGDRNIGLYRPLVQISYLFDGALFGFRPAASHLLNALIHAGVASWGCRLFRALRMGPGLAMVSALALGFHPALLDASVWISGRTDLLASLFVILGLSLAISAAAAGEGSLSRRSWLLGLCLLLGLLSKEMAGTLPLLVLALPGKGHWRRLPLLATAGLIYLGLRAGAVEGFLPRSGGIALPGLGLGERLGLASRALLWLLIRLPFPFHLAGDHRAHPWAQSDAELGASAWLSLGVLVGLLALGLVLRRRTPRAGFFLSALPLSLLPLLQIIPIGAVMAERFLYLPAVFALPLLLETASSLIPGRFPRGGRFALAAALLGILALGSIQRFPVYHDRGAFSADVIRAYPDDWAAANNLGVYLFLERRPPDYPGAVAAFESALAHRPAYPRARLNLARSLLQWQASEPGEELLDRAAAALVGLKLQDPRRLYLEGKIALRRASFHPGAAAEILERAWGSYRRGARRFEARTMPRRAAAAWKEAGIAARRLGDRDRAALAWSRALTLDPKISGAPAMRRFLKKVPR